MDTPRIQNTTGKSFDGSTPDYGSILAYSSKAGLDFMLDAGRTSAAVDTANENTLLRAQELQLQANNSAFEKLIAMTKLGVDLQDNVAKNNIGRERNSIDWFQTALQADQNKMALGLKMEELEMQRQHHNADIKYKYSALNQNGYSGTGVNTSGGGGGMFKQGWGGASQPSTTTFTPTPQTQKNSVDSWGVGLSMNQPLNPVRKY